MPELLHLRVSNFACWSDSTLRRFGDYDAVVMDGRVWRASGVHDQACRLAGALVERGIRPGDRVVLLLPNAIEMVVAFAATIRSGAVAVPLVPGASASEIERIAGLSTPAALVTTLPLARTAERVSSAMPVRIGVGVDAAAGDWADYESLIREPRPLESPVPRDSTHPAVICYTSGTSGTPKGVVHTHGSVHARHGGGTRRLPARILVALPLGALGAGMLTGRLAHQWTLILQEAFEPRRFLAAIERHRVTKLVMVPSMGEALLAQPDLQTYDLSSLRSVGFTGADVPATLLARLAAVLPVNPSVAYGMTETGGGIAASGLHSKPGSVGRILKGVDVKIVDEHGEEVARGGVGEIVVRTPWMGAGYYQQSAETAETFAGGWLRTGDLGRIDEDGELFLAGRRKDLIIQNGVKVAPRDVLDAVQTLPGIAECAVVGLPHALLGEQVVACVVRRAGSAIAGDEILDCCRQRLDPRKVPVRVSFRDALPKTPSHKIDLPELRRRLLADEAALVETTLARRLRSAPPMARVPLLREAIEEALRRILPAAGRPAPGSRVDPRASFGEMGLDSLRVAQLAHLLGEVLGRPIAPTLFFTHPNVEALCGHLAKDIAGAAPVTTAPAKRRGGAREPVAIVGCGCRLPGGVETPDQFWSLLARGIDATGEISRWNVDAFYDPARGTPGRTYTRRAALLDSPDLFDAGFFGLTPREALRLDPQHRLVLEVAWEALEHAGYDPRGFSEKRAGLFLGISGASSPGAGPGAAPSMAVGRLCHFLDLRGPALAVDTACSSSLAAVHTAVQSLRLGECDVALAGGVQVIGSLRSFVALSEISLMAADGRCKAFDAGADGFGRGEGCVLIVLKRLGDAEADRDRIVAVVRGSAARHDGRSSSLTAPNGRAQQEVIRGALEDGGVAPADVDYLEAHGTGTALGDPIEIDAAMAVLADDSRPLIVGSVKTNIGHLESAAGAAGLLKTALALEHGVIPAHLHCHTLNPLLEPLASRFVIPKATQPWPGRPGHRRVAGVTSMGLSGTNVHLVLEEAPEAARRPDDQASGPQLLCLSARTAAALRRLAERHADRLAGVAAGAFADYCFTANAGRAHFVHRLAVIARDPPAARGELLAYAAGEGANIRRGGAASRDDRDRRELLEALAERYVRGLDPDWSGVYAGGAFHRMTLPTYPFERKPYGRTTATVRPRRDDTEAVPRPAQPERPAARPPAARPEPRMAELVDLVRQQVADVLGRPPESLPADENCLALGIDSLGVLDIVTAVRERTGMACAPADFIARPTIAGLAAFAASRLAAARSDAASEPEPSPLVVVNDRGLRAPLFCMHPSGGQVTAYLRLRSLLGDDHPLFAIQSRALHEPEREHPTIESMALDYATLVQAARPAEPYRLLGWSMGGLIALAVASELERRGAEVEMVGLLDVIPPDAHLPNRPDTDLAFALTAIASEVRPSVDPPDVAASDLETFRAIPRADLLAWCETRGWIPAGALARETFDAMLRLYERHFQLARDYRPAVVGAPIVEWRAGSLRRRYQWSKHSRTGAVEKCVGGTHFSVMHPPHIELVAADLEGDLAPHAWTALAEH